MLMIALSFLVAFVGFLTYLLNSNPKLAEMGRIAFGFGLLVFLLNVEQVVVLFGR